MNNGEDPPIRTCHSVSEPSRPTPGTFPSLHNGVGPGGTGRFVLPTTSSIMLGASTVTSAWAEIACNCLHVLLQQYSADFQQQLLSSISLLFELVVDV